MLKKIVVAVLGISVCFCKASGVHEEKPIVLMVTSYNNKDWYRRNLDSIFSQNYSNYKVVYIDDRSPDGTGQLVEDYIREYGVEEKIILVRNTERQLKVANFYYGVHQFCSDKTIVIDLDGDDFLAHENVLSIINEVYSDPNVWLTYGSYVAWPRPLLGGAEELSQEVIANCSYRESEWVTTHLKSFYAWLFKGIKAEDLMYDDEFFDSTGDVAMMFPMLEMASKNHIQFIPDILYVYNTSNPLCGRVDKSRAGLSKQCVRIIVNKKKYQRIEE